MIINNDRSWIVSKAARTIFYRRRALVWAGIASYEKKSSHLSFVSFSPPTCWIPDWIPPPPKKIVIFSENNRWTSQFIPFIFFPSSDISWPGIFYFYFFPSTMEEIPLSESVNHRIYYSTCSLRSDRISTWLRFVTGDYTLRTVTSPFGHFYLGWTILIRNRIEFKMAKMPAFRGWPLMIMMIWGAEEKSKMDLFFPRECLLRNIFFQGGLLKFIFSWGLLRIFFSLYKPIKNCLIFFFSHEIFSGFIFSWGGPFEIYFFLVKAFWDLFFPGEDLSRFIFSWRTASEIFFYRFPPGLPPIINGRPLTNLKLLRMTFIHLYMSWQSISMWCCIQWF